ncbi:MAG: hypothetical protein N4A44_05125 [Alphaproteobacteria bacterium]|jgi:uncharacterized membrane protein|nr:hypothetical protein [Alphaproteobacteria bacterium]
MEFVLVKNIALNFREIVCKYGVYLLYILLLLPYLFALGNLRNTFDTADKISSKADVVFNVVNRDEVKSQLKKSANEVAGTVVVSTKNLTDKEMDKDIEMEQASQATQLSEHFQDPLKLDYVDYYLKKVFPCDDCKEGEQHYILRWIEDNILSFFKNNIFIYVFIFSFIPIISVWAILAMFLRFVYRPFFMKYDDKDHKSLVLNHLYNVKSIYWENFILSILGVFTAVAIIGVLVVFYAHFRYFWRSIKGIRFYRSGKKIKFI